MVPLTWGLAANWSATRITDNGVATVAVIPFGPGMGNMHCLAAYSALQFITVAGLVAGTTAITMIMVEVTTLRLANEKLKLRLTTRPKVNSNDLASHFKALMPKPEVARQERLQSQVRALALVDLKVLMPNQVARVVVHPEPGVVHVSESNRRYGND